MGGSSLWNLVNDLTNGWPLARTVNDAQTSYHVDLSTGVKGVFKVFFLHEEEQLLTSLCFRFLWNAILSLFMVVFYLFILFMLNYHMCCCYV